MHDVWFVDCSPAPLPAWQIATARNDGVKRIATSGRPAQTGLMRTIPFLVLMACGAVLGVVRAAGTDDAALAAMVEKVNPAVVAWRRDFHQHPELSNRELRTAGIVAKHLQGLGLEVQTGVAKTGVVAVLEGARPGPTIVLRADMDALPVTEQTDVPFRSTVTTTYRDETVGVMHACGHDAHVAILMGVAEILTRLRAQLPGKVVFLFQPAEEGPPEGEEGGAQLMLKEGVFARHQPAAVFGLHVHSMLPAGEIGFRPGAFMAGADTYRLTVTGRQTHGARPWMGIDPVVVAAQIVTSLQTVVSRQVDLTLNPAIVSVSVIRGGVRHNIIPGSVEMLGTIRTFSDAQRAEVLESVERIATHVAAASGASAKFELTAMPLPVTYNDPALMQRTAATLARVVGSDNMKPLAVQTPSEDYAFYGREAPAVFFWIGAADPGADPATVAENHSPLFHVDERALPVGVRALTQLAVDYLTGTM
jgi:amidohydrolase